MASNIIFDAWDSFVAAMRQSLSAYMEPPASTIVILLLSLTLTVISVTVTRLITDVKRRNEYQLEIQEYMRELRQAQKSDDKRLYEKLKRKEDRIKRLQLQTSRDSMKTSFLFMIPYFLIYYLFNGVFWNPATGLSRVVAFAPLPLPFWGTELTFFSWYFLCSLGLNTPIMRATGLTTESGVPPVKSAPAKPGEGGKGKRTDPSRTP